MTAVYMGLSLILGLVAWGLAGDAVRRKDTKLLGVSWVCCAIPLLFQILVLELTVRSGDISALLDTIHGHSLCSRVLVLGNGILSLLALVRSRRK